MSTIAAKINFDEKVIHVGADTYIGTDSKRRNYKSGKIYHREDIGVLIGSCGPMESIHFVKSVLENNEGKELNEIADVFYKAETPEQITKFFKDIHHHMINDRAKEHYHESTFLIVKNGRVYKHNNFLTLEPEADYLAIGSGSRYAEAILELGASVVDALRVAAKLDTRTNGEAFYQIKIE